MNDGLFVGRWAGPVLVGLTSFYGGVLQADPEHDSGDTINELPLGRSALQQEALELQVTAGSEVRLAEQAESEHRLEIEFGLCSSLQVGAELPIEYASGRGAVGGPELSLQASPWVAGESAWVVVLGLEASLPGPSGDTDWATGAYVSTFGSHAPFWVNVAVGGELQTEPELEASLEAGVAFGLEIGPWVPLVDVVANSNGVDPDAVLVAVGCLWHPGLEAELGLAVVAGVDDGSAVWGGVAQASFEFDLGADGDGEQAAHTPRLTRSL